MTKQRHEISSLRALTKSFFALFSFLFLSLFLSDEISAATLEGLNLALNLIVPTAFPFMVLADTARHTFEFEKSNFFSTAFERIFKINRCGISAFLAGATGGFPIGAKIALEQYKDGKISKSECERLASFTNIASPAYTVYAVGIGMLSSFKLGLTLYFVSLISAIVSGALLGINKHISPYTEFKSKQSFNAVDSIKSAATASINLIFFISFFSAICRLIKKLGLPKLLEAIMISFSEVGNSTRHLSELYIFPFRLSVALISFSLSFSGLSVIMQSLALDGTNSISKRKFISYKLLQGTVSFLIIIALPI